MATVGAFMKCWDPLNTSLQGVKQLKDEGSHSYWACFGTMHSSLQSAANDSLRRTFTHLWGPVDTFRFFQHYQLRKLTIVCSSTMTQLAEHPVFASRSKTRWQPLSRSTLFKRFRSLTPFVTDGFHTLLWCLSNQRLSHQTDPFTAATTKSEIKNDYLRDGTIVRFHWDTLHVR